MTKKLEAIVTDGYGFNDREDKKSYRQAKQFLTEVGIHCSYERRRENRGSAIRVEDVKDDGGLNYSDLVFVSRDKKGHIQEFHGLNAAERPDYYIIYTPFKGKKIRIEYGVCIGSSLKDILGNVTILRRFTKFAEEIGGNIVFDQEKDTKGKSRYVVALIFEMKSKEYTPVAKELGSFHRYVSRHLGYNNK